MKLLLLSSLLIPTAFAAYSLKPLSCPSEAGTVNTVKNVSIKPACTEMPGFISRKWMMEEIRFLQDNEPFYYKRGDLAESNMNFDNDWLVFNCDGSGVYHQGDGIEYDLNWILKEGKNITLEYTITKFRDNSDLKVKLEDIRLNVDHVTYTEYYTHKKKVHSLGVVKRMAANEITETSIANR
jgi:hypothetical protein